MYGSPLWCDAVARKMVRVSTFSRHLSDPQLKFSVITSQTEEVKAGFLGQASSEGFLAVGWHINVSLSRGWGNKVSGLYGLAPLSLPCLACTGVSHETAAAPARERERECSSSPLSLPAAPLHSFQKHTLSLISSFPLNGHISKQRPRSEWKKGCYVSRTQVNCSGLYHW